MVPLEFTGAKIQHLATHLVGNKLLEEGIKFSEQESIIEEATRDYLHEYFFQGFRSEDYYAFRHEVDLNMNTVYRAASLLFDNRSDFIKISQEIAETLFENSLHPKIKTGEFNLAYIKDVQYGDEILDAIGIFKSETKVPFIKMEASDQKYLFTHDTGYSVNGIDKAAIIFNTDKEDGYRVLTSDHTNKGSEASYWGNDFLKLEAVQNEFHHTKVVMNIAKDFMNEHVKEKFDVSRAEQIDLLNKSADYFKENEKFDSQKFATEIFDDPQMASSFQNYNTQYQSDHNVKLEDDLSLSEEAVKKYGKVFKSILKLDKNFSIYIHGDKSLIQRGREVDGRKFYKIYFENEK